MKISPSDKLLILKEIYNKDTVDWIEESVLLCFDRRNKLIGFYKISSGGLNSTIIDQRVVMQICLNANAHKFVISHNHPSGNLKPSDSDMKITKTLQECGRIMDIDLLDHIIYTDGKLYSFADEGLL